MTGSLARAVARRAAALLAGTLLLVGIVTTGAVWALQAEALDTTLVTAARGDAHHPPRWPFEVDDAPPAAHTWRVEPGDPRVAPDRLAALGDDGPPVFYDDGDDRIVLLAAEDHGRHGEEHVVVGASAPRVRVGTVVVQVALPYAVVAGVAAAVAALALRRQVAAAFAPLNEARGAISRVVGLGQGTRLPVVGPDEVRPVLEAVNELLERLDVAAMAERRFTAEAAHELRTPVTVMLGELDVALRGAPTGEDARATLTSAREEVLRMRELVEALTTLARVEAGQADAGHERIHLQDLVAGAIRAEEPELRAAGCPVRVEVSADPELGAEVSLVRIAVANLLRNAARHAPGAAVTVRLGAEGGFATITVHDEGPGISEADRDTIFTRFGRGARARTRDRRGLGLGLPLAREIARRHGGDCELVDGGRGATVRLRLMIS